MNIKKHIIDLKNTLNEHNHSYYVLDSPIISDSEYDLLLRELESLEKKHPEFASSDSPTQRVGATPLDAFQRIDHRLPMLSLENAMNDEEIHAFYERVVKRLETSKNLTFIAIQFKMSSKHFYIKFFSYKLPKSCHYIIFVGVGKSRNFKKGRKLIRTQNLHTFR